MRYLSWPYTCSLLHVYSPWGTCPGRTPAVCYTCTHHKVLVLAVHLQSVTCVLTMRYLSWPYTCSLLHVYSPWGTCPGRTPAVCYTCTHHEVLVLAVHLQSVTRVLTIRYLSWPYTCSLLHVYLDICSLLRVATYLRLRSSRPCRNNVWQQREFLQTEST